MQFYVKKLLPVASMSMLAAALVHADYNDTNSASPTPLNDQNINGETQQKKNTKKIINPSARPQVQDGVDLFITGDYIIWQGNETGLGFAIQNNSSNATTLNSANVKNPHFSYKSGFKAGVGYNIPHDGWDISLNWTWLHDSAHGNANFDGGNTTLFPTFINPVFAGTNPVRTNAASSHLKLRLNDVNLDFGREFATSKWLTLRPHMGVRSAWLNQQYTVHYETVRTAGTILYGDYTTKMKNRYWGIGLNAGLDTQWGIGSGFSFFGNAGAAILYGFFRIQDKETSTSVANVSTLQQNVFNSYHASRAITDLQMGLRWDHMFFHNGIHLGIQAGWEHHLYFSQNQFMRFASSVEQGSFFQNQGDLAFQGWTVGIRIDF